MSFGEFSNCPCCRHACPVDQLTCGIGKAYFAEREEKLAKEKAAKEKAGEPNDENT